MDRNSKNRDTASAGEISDHEVEKANSKNIEELLVNHLVQGAKLMEQWCPACNHPLLKVGETPALLSPSKSLSTASSFDSTATDIEDVEWKPVEGVPYCVVCEAHVVTNEKELAFAAENFGDGKRQKKGSLTTLLEGIPEELVDKPEMNSANSSPEVSPVSAEVHENVEEDKMNFYQIESEVSRLPVLNGMKSVASLPIPSMQSRAEVASINQLMLLSPLSDLGVEQDVVEFETHVKQEEEEAANEGLLLESAVRHAHADSEKEFEPAAQSVGSTANKTKTSRDKVDEDSDEINVEGMDYSFR